MATNEIRARGDFAAPLRAPRTTAWARNRELLSELVRRDVQARYRGSVFGILWSLFNPLVFMVVYTVVFSHFANLHFHGVSYPAYIIAGLLAWNFFSQGLSSATSSIVSNAGLVRKVSFAWILLTVSSVLAALINYLISLVLLVPFFIIFHLVPGWPLVLLPVLVLVTFALVLGLGLVLAAGNVFFRDLEYLVTVVTLVWFYLTPIIYQLSLVYQHDHGTLGRLFGLLVKLNPMTWIVTAQQDVLEGNQWPQHWHGLLYAVVVAALAVAVGVGVFERFRRRFAEEV